MRIWDFQSARPLRISRSKARNFRRICFQTSPLKLSSRRPRQAGRLTFSCESASSDLGAAENMSFGEVPASGSIDSNVQFESEFKKLKRFERMMNLIFILSDREIIEVQHVEEDGRSHNYFIIAETVPEDLRPLLGELRQLIGLSDRNRFRITDRVTNIKDDEISIQTRSVMAMMEFMARGVEVPLEHLEDGWVIDYGLQTSDGEVAKGLIPFRMRSSKNRPAKCFCRRTFQ